MALLEGKTALIFGLANQRSIAWGITKAFHNHGCRLGVSYAGAVLEKRVLPLVEEIGCGFAEPCDVSSDSDIEMVVQKAAKKFGQVDILVHAIAYADREELEGTYLQTSRNGFRNAMDISVYSFTALARAFRPLMSSGGSLLTLTYYGSEKVMPHYNIMGVAKAALEASVRYLANDLGPDGIRVNAISAGPIRTLAAAGISGFRSMYSMFEEFSPLRQHITIEDVGETAVFLCSNMAAKITGEVLYVDSGYNILGITEHID